jgi:hypothetical protein
MNSQQENLSPPAERPSFFSVPPNFFLWARVGARFWGGLLAGIGSGLFLAKSLEELGVFKLVWVGFVAIALVGGGLGIAFKAVRRDSKPNTGKPLNS